MLGSTDLKDLSHNHLATLAVSTVHPAEVHRSRSVGVDSGRSLNDFRK